MSVTTELVPMPLPEVVPILEPHLSRFAAVLTTAWEHYTELRDLPGSALPAADPSARATLISSFTRVPAHQQFAGIDGVRVEDRYQRPWVNLDGGRVQVRFRKLTAALEHCRSDSERAQRLDYHLGDPWLDFPVEATILTCGYVLDLAELNLQRLALVCHVGPHVHYVVPLPGGTATDQAPIQLPLSPLSPPIIRSAREAAGLRLARKDAAGD